MSAWLEYKTDLLGMMALLKNGQIDPANGETFVWLNQIDKPEWSEAPHEEQLEFNFGQDFVGANPDREPYDPTKLEYGVVFEAEQIDAERWIEIGEQLELDLEPMQGPIDDPIYMLDEEFLESPDICMDCKADYVANWWVAGKALKLEDACGFSFPLGTTHEDIDELCKASGAIMISRAEGLH